MDTSIIVVIAIIVVFAIVVPTMIRKSATELSRVEIDTVPDQAQVVAADPQIPGHDHTERAKVFHSSGTIEPTVPRPNVAPMTDAPKFSLTAPAPEFALIDGHADSRSTTSTDATAITSSTAAEAGAEHQRSTLPVAVGEARSTYFEGHSHSAHEASASATNDNVRMLHPAVHAVFNQSGQGPSGVSSSGRGAGSGSHLGEHSGTIPIQQRSARAATASTAETTRRGTQIPNPSFGADEDRSMTERATTLRESKKSLGARTRGFALVFLASALGTLVTGVLALFSVVHVALAGVFLGLAIFSLVIVRSLNLRRREVKARLRGLEGRPGTAESAAPQTDAAPQATADRAPATPKAAAPTTAETKPAEAPPAGSTKAAQARAVMQRNVSAKQTREEADTGEIPLVHIRNEAAEGHTTRQVLLTGPIPIVEEAATDAAASDDAETETADKTSTVESASVVETREDMAPAAESATSAESALFAESPTADSTSIADSKSTTDSAPATDAAPAAVVAPEAASSDAADAEAIPSKAGSANVSDPFMQRLQARDAWSPMPLPVPSYVDAPQVEHPVPEAKAADASSYASYETEARSREDIAAQFAAELGYRPELSDSARDDGPLEHGRKAIRTNKAPKLGAVDDVLARRRA